MAGAYPGVSFLDCGAPYLEGADEAAKGLRITEDLMPDALHPNVKGDNHALTPGHVPQWECALFAGREICSAS